MLKLLKYKEYLKGAIISGQSRRVCSGSVDERSSYVFEPMRRFRDQLAAIARPSAQ
jgi:hypothetical protein